MCDVEMAYLKGRVDALREAHEHLRRKYGYTRNGSATPEGPVLWDLDVLASSAQERLHREGASCG